MSRFDLGRIIRGLEAQLFDPQVRASPDRVAALLSDDFLEFGRSGRVYGQEEVIRSLTAEDRDATSVLRACGYELRTLAEDVVLLTYRTMRKREGRSEFHSLRSSIWKMVDPRWKMTFHQATPTNA